MEKKEKHSIVKKGEIYYIDIEEGVGSEQKGQRPILIVQNNKGNKYSPTIIGLIMTSVSKNNYLPVHKKIKKKESNLPYDSYVMGEQIRTFDKKRLGRKVGKVSDKTLKQIDEVLKISLGIQ